MRLTLFAPLLFGSNGQFVSATAIALQSHADVTLVVPAHYQSDPEFQGNVVRLPTPSNRLARGLFWFNPMGIPSVARALRQTQPDVLHLLNGPGYLPTLLLPRLVPGTPLVVTVHDPVAHSGSRADFVAVAAGRRFLWRRATRLHAVSHFAAEQLYAQGFDPRTIVVTRHGALTEVFSRHNHPDIQRGQSLLFFGRWETYKGIDLLVEAIVALNGEGFRQHCILAGPGDVPPATRAMIEAHPELFEVHNRFLSDEEVAHLFQRANRTVLPYRDATQSSLPALAQAYGHLIVASAVGSFPEEVTLQGGLLIQPNSVPALAEAIRRSQSLQPKTDTPVDYSWETVASQLTQAYTDILTGAGQI